MGFSLTDVARRTAPTRLAIGPPRAINAESPGFSAATQYDFTPSCSQIHCFHDDYLVQSDCERDSNTKYDKASPIVTRQLKIKRWGGGNDVAATARSRDFRCSAAANSGLLTPIARGSLVALLCESASDELVVCVVDALRDLAQRLGDEGAQLGTRNRVWDATHP